ncbi:MAG: hypothetical protein EI684_00590 [Candidatus Viridilinea halotolerans]|uniref:Uncharacterized protein n=1 Tax=Candidatus Viridilinea halotolerans TaxID=2491704 RepID=A0A426UBP1_9CHLR|nr:MAG: hypothetical protein EI684_00590 [Candidatus Viridilinea halotolerans]
MGADATNLVVGLVGVVLTLLVFSRLLGDNPAYRLVQYLFIGISLGYAFVVIYHHVLRPAVLEALAASADPPLLALRLIPWLLGLLLLTRISGRQTISWLANIPLALLFGVGTALAVGGALLGTLVPQILDTVRPVSSDPFQLVGSIFLLLGVILTLCYFYFTLPPTNTRGRLVAYGAQAGRWLLMVAFGFFFAGGLLTYLTALNTRLEFIVGWLRAPFG